MAYLGPPPSQKLATPTSQYFSGNGSATAFTLNRPVNVSEDLNVFVNNVPQEPGSGKSYTATGTTLTFDAAPASGTNNVYVVYRGLAEPTTRLEHPSGQPLAATTGTFSGAFTSPGIDDNADATAITISSGELVGIGETSPTSALHIKGGAGTNLAIQSTAGTHWRIGDGVGSTNGNLVIYDYTDSRKVFEIDTLGRVTTPAQPAFHAYGTGSSWVVFSNGSWTKLVLNATPPLNIGSHYDSTNSKFVAPIAGVYHFYYKVYGRVQSGGAASTYWQSRFQKNNNAIAGYGSMLMGYQYNVGGVDETATYSMTISLAASDEITVHAISTGAQNGEYYPSNCEFGGHLVG